MTQSDDRRSGQDRREDDGPLSSGVLLLRAIESLEARMVKHNEAMRADMNANFGQLRADFRAHEDEDRREWLRIHDLEQREQTSRDTITKRNLIGSGIVSAIVGPGAAFLFKKWFG